jgi:Spy/CpxP family protein refolding chaperone
MLMSMLVVLLAAGMVAAQDDGGRRGRGGRERRAGRMMGGGGAMAALGNLDALELTEEQKEQIEKLRAEFQAKMEGQRDEMRKAFEEMRKFRQDNPDDREGLQKKRQEMMQKMAPMREATQNFLESVKGVLNEEQLKKFNELTAQAPGRGGFGGRMGVGQMGGRFGRAQGALPGMDPRTMNQLELTDEQKDKVRGLLQRFAEEQQQLVEKYQGLFKEMLTPEQAEKFAQLQKEANDRMGQLRARRGRGPENGEGPQRGRPRNRDGGAADAPPPPPGADDDAPPPPPPPEDDI